MEDKNKIKGWTSYPRKWWRTLVSILLKFLRRLGKFPRWLGKFLRWLAFTEMGWFLIFLFVETIVISGFFYFYGGESKNFEFARTLTLAIGAVGGAYGLILGARRSAKFSEQVDTAQKQLFNEQLGRGAELLAKKEMVMIRAGIRVLGNLAEKAIGEPEQVKLIMQIINDFVCSKATPSLEDKETEDKEAKDRDDIVLGIRTLGSLYNKSGKSFELRELVQFRGCHLERLGLNSANLQGASFWDANLQGANFRHSDLQEADFFFAKLQRANISFTNLQGAQFGSAKLHEANFNLANLQGTRFPEAELQRTILVCADLRGADFVSAKFQGADFKGARLEWMNCTGADFLDAKNLKEDQIKMMIFSVKHPPILPEGLEQFLDPKRGYEWEDGPDDNFYPRRNHFVKSDAEWAEREVEEWVDEYLTSIRKSEQGNWSVSGLTNI